MGKFQDLTGQRFGKLVVIKRVENDNNKKVRWLCICDCGNYHVTIANSLKQGLCKSCGCLNSFINPKANPKRVKVNTYDLSGEYGIGYTSKHEPFYFDLEDYDLISKYNWTYDKRKYVKANTPITNKKISMHRLVMNATNPNIKVDHIYHVNYDNRKSQLRLATNSENQHNQKIHKNNTSGVTGVYWHKKHQKWEALIAVDNHIMYLGLFESKDDAIKARQEQAEKYFGEFRYRPAPNDNFNN